MQKQRNTHAVGAAAVLAAALFIAATGPRAAAQEPSDGMVEWPYVGADQGASKYSPLADIDASNVDGLEIAWTWEPNELPNQEFRTRPGSFEVMPLMIDDVVYVSTMYTRVVALDAETGDELWAFDPQAWRTGPEGGPPGGFKHRGVAVWPATANRQAGAGGDMRVFINSRDSLYALDATDGSLIPGFGDGGRVLLTEGFPNPVTHEMFDQTSPPVVFEDLVIVGSRVPDRIQKRFDTPGSVQAFDVHTGERRWVFYTVPQSNDAFGADTWEGGSWRFTGHANVWGLMSLDAERGAAVRAHEHPEQRLLGRPAARRQPVRRVAGLPRRPHRRARVALPGRAPRAVGLRLHVGAEPHDPERRRPHHRRGRRGVEAGLHLRVRPRHRRAGVAHRGAPRRHRDRRAGRGAVPDPAVPYEAAAVRGAGGLARRRERPDARDPPHRDRGAADVPAGAALHAPQPAGHAAAAAGGRRRQLGRGRARPHHQPALRAHVGRRVGQPGLRDRPRAARGRRRLHEQLPARRIGRHLPGAGRVRPRPSGAASGRYRSSSRRTRGSSRSI